MACVQPAWADDYYIANKPGSGADTKEDPFGLADLPKPDIFKDESSWELLPKWKTAARDGDAMGPANVALVLDVKRYGPTGRDYHPQGKEK